MNNLNKYIIPLLLALTFLPEVGLSQQVVGIDIEKKVAITGLKDFESVGGMIFVNSDLEKLEYKEVGLITLAEAAREALVKDISISDAQTGEPGPLVELENGKYCFDKPGRWRVSVFVLDFDKRIYGKQDTIIVIGDAPVPEPDDPPEPDNPPEPQPAPEGPFDGLAAKVYSVAKNMKEGAKLQIYRVLIDVAAGLKPPNPKFLVTSDAVKYINDNWPESVGQVLVLDELISKDAANRKLSRQELIKYYEEIARGLE